MKTNWLWDKDVTEQQVKAILADPKDPKFIAYAALLLSRTNSAKDVFRDFLSRENFFVSWTKIKRHMRKDSWNDPRIEYWQAIYETLAAQFKEKGVSIRPPKEKTIRDESCQKVGNEIKDGREELDWTQKDLAQRLGISQQIISRIESGRGNMSILTLKKISQVLGRGFDIKPPLICNPYKFSDGNKEVIHA